MVKVDVTKIRGYVGQFIEFCESCGHSQRVHVWRGRRRFNCSVCGHRNNLKPYNYYRKEVT